jgi:transcriptional regulator with XRE-family HTH domain
LIDSYLFFLSFDAFGEAGFEKPLPGDTPATAACCIQARGGASVNSGISYQLWIGAPVALSFGSFIKQAREVRRLSALDAARAAGISAAYLSKLENDAVKKPSPHVLHQLSEALTVPYAELMRLNGYRLPDEQDRSAGDSVAAALFADLTDDEREELLAYLAWYRARRRSARGTEPAGR